MLIKTEDMYSTLGRKFYLLDHIRNKIFRICHRKSVIKTLKNLKQTTRAIVVRTGFNSARGALVQSILFPKPINVKFERDGLIFIGIMAVLGFFGFVYSVVITLYGCLSAWDTIAKSLDLVTTIVPPALPAALRSGSAYSNIIIEFIKSTHYKLF